MQLPRPPLEIGHLYKVLKDKFFLYEHAKLMSELQHDGSVFRVMNRGECILFLGYTHVRSFRWLLFLDLQNNIKLSESEGVFYLGNIEKIS